MRWITAAASRDLYSRGTMRSITTAALALTATTALAQQQPQQCFPTEKLVAALASEHGEVPVAFGGSGSGMFVLFASDGGATWTLTVNRGPVLCMLAAGEGWQTTPFQPPKKPDGGA